MVVRRAPQRRELGLLCAFLSAMVKRPAAAASSTSSTAALPAQALNVRPEWCRAIFAGAKRWELRSTRTTKRGPICIAESGARRLVGRATIADCFAVGVRGPDGRWVPAGQAPEDAERFWLREENLVLHGAQGARVLDAYQRLFAWVLSDVEAFEPPLAWDPPTGAVQFANLASRVHACPSRSAGRDRALERPAKTRRAGRGA